MFGASFQTFELVTDRYNDEELDCPLNLGDAPCDCSADCFQSCCNFVGPCVN